MNKEIKTITATVLAFVAINGLPLRNNNSQIIAQDRLTLDAGSSRKDSKEILAGDVISIMARDNSGNGGVHTINIDGGTFQILHTRQNFTKIEGETNDLGIRTGKRTITYEKDGYKTSQEITIKEKN